jgi:hypothetical protein
MPQQALSNLGINFNWDIGQDAWKAGVDNNWVLLDALVQPNVADKDLSTPPGSPALGDRYIVGSSPSGAWASKTNQVAVYDGVAWRFAVPREGWTLYVQDEDRHYYYTGSAWQVLVIREHVHVKTALTASSTTTLNAALGGDFTLSMTTSVSTLTISNVMAGDVTRLSVRIQQDATGGRTLTWPASFKWEGGAAQSISSAANAVDLLEIVSYDGGTTWLAELRKAWA